MPVFPKFTKSGLKTILTNLNVMSECQENERK